MEIDDRLHRLVDDMEEAGEVSSIAAEKIRTKITEFYEDYVVAATWPAAEPPTDRIQLPQPRLQEDVTYVSDILQTPKQEEEQEKDLTFT